MEYKKNIETLSNFLKLKKDWNQYGAEPFTKSHIEFVKKIISKINPQPEIFPTAASSIHLVYDIGYDYSLIFSIKDNSDISYYKRDRKGICEKQTTEEEIQEIIDNFLSQEEK